MGKSALWGCSNNFRKDLERLCMHGHLFSQEQFFSIIFQGKFLNMENLLFK